MYYVLLLLMANIMNKRDQRLKNFVSIQHFPVLAKLHYHENKNIVDAGKQVIDDKNANNLSQEQNLTMSPRKPSSPKSHTRSPKSSRVMRNIDSQILSSTAHFGDTTVIHSKPFFPSSPSKAKKLTERKMVSVSASSPYIPLHKIGCVPAAEKKKKFMHGEFFPSSKTSKKGCRLEDIFLNSADLYTKTMQMVYLKKQSRRNLVKIHKRQKEMLKTGVLDVPTNAAM